MHPELAALLREARRRPEDDPARLVLADWLEENGDDSDRQWADLIRTEVQLFALHSADSDWTSLVARAKALRSARPAWWAGAPLDDHGIGPVGPAGGLCRLQLRLFGGEAGANWQLLERHPLLPFVDGFHLFSYDGPGFANIDAAALSDFVGGPVAEGRGFLALSCFLDENHAGCGVEGHFLRPLLASPGLNGLAWLVLGDCHLTAHAAEMLAGSPHLGGLRRLELSNNDLGPYGAAQLGHGNPRPAHLGLALNNLRAAGVEALLGTPLAAHLRSLDLSGNGIGDRGARALAESPYLGGLSYLYINLTALAPADQARLRGRYGDRVH
jgi:uncharacterized protein (TIGR02996 family)